MLDRGGAPAQLRVWLLGPFLVERRKDDGVWEPVEAALWEKHGYARLLFKRLLCAGGRRVERTTFIEDLWPDPENPDAVERYPNDAVYRLRKILGMPDVVKTFGQGSGYAVADQSMVWVDADECESLLKEAERVGRITSTALTLLERAQAYLERGDYLEGQAGQWCYARRGTMERLRYRCRRWLAEAYEQQGQAVQAEHLYNRLLEDDPSDEDVLSLLMNLLHRQGMTRSALHCFEKMKKLLQLEQLTFSAAMEAFVEKLRNEPCQYLIQVTEPIGSYNNAIEVTSSPLLELDSLEIIRSRRAVLQGALNIASSALVLSPFTLLNPDSQERLESAFLNPLRIDTNALNDLADITRGYWRLCANASVDLLSGIYGHFTTVTQMLRETHSLSTYRKLCSLAGENAQILGKTLYDIREYGLAWKYYLFSIKAAQEAQNELLRVAGLGRMALLLIYCDQSHKAIPILRDAQQDRFQNARLSSWLAAVEAEVYAHLGDFDSCTRLLDVSKNITANYALEEDIYATGFNLSRQSGYEGACFVRLLFPEQALPALQKAFELAHPTAIRRRSTLLTDMSAVYAQLGDIKESCTLACQALDITIQTRSLNVLQRIYAVRNTLVPWDDHIEVKTLDEQITNTILSISKTKEL